MQQPTQVGRIYVIEDKLGEGGMGTVYRARNRVSGMVVALKTTRTDVGEGTQGQILRLTLAREFQALASLSHPNIIRVLDYGFDDVLGPYFTMELLFETGDLVAIAQDLSVRDKIRLLTQMLQALAYLHRRQLVHRDLKPSNVMVDQGRVKVVDFGLVASKRWRDPFGAGGTLEYMAPELFLGQGPSIRSDLYAAGAVAYRILADRPLYRTSEILGILSESKDSLSPQVVELLRAVRTEPEETDPHEHLRVAFEQLNSLVGPRIGWVLNRLLAQDPNERYGDATEAIRDFAEAMGERLPVETPETRESFLRAADFVGREHELNQLSIACEHAVARRGSAWLIGGESGVGKSRLMDELRIVALVAGATVLQGQAVVDAAASYFLWSQIVRALCVISQPTDQQAAVLQALVPDIEQLLGREVPPVTSLDAEAAQSRLFTVIQELLRNQTRPIVILLEDLQWAGTESIALLRHVSRFVYDTPVLLVANYRDDEAPGLPNLLPEMKPISLSTLSSDGVRELCRSMLGEAGLQPWVLEFVERESQGNFFSVIEIVRALAEESGALQQISRERVPSYLLEGGIERIIERRLNQVPEGGRELLQAAAIIGRQIDVQVMRELFPHVDLGTWLIICANVAVFSCFGYTWRFAHDKLREALLARMSSVEKRVLHNYVAQAIEKIYPGADDKHAALAHHYRAAGNRARAAEHALRAGETAARMYAFAEARKHYAEHLADLDSLPDKEGLAAQKAQALLRLVETSAFSDSPEENLARMRRAEELIRQASGGGELPVADRLKLARIYYWMGRSHYIRGRPREALASYDHVIPLVNLGEDDEILVMHRWSFAQALTGVGEYGRAIDFAWQAIAPAEALGNWIAWVRAVALYGLSLAAHGQYKAGLAECRRALQKAIEINHHVSIAAARMYLSFAHLMAGEWDSMLKESWSAMEPSEQSQEQVYISLSWSLIAWAECHLGEVEAAMEHRAKGKALAQTLGGRLNLEDWFDAADAEMALKAGKVDDAIARAKLVIAYSEASDLLFSLGRAQRVLALAFAVKGSEQAEVQIAESIRTFERGSMAIEAARSCVAWGRIFARRGNWAGARERYELGISRLKAYGADAAAHEAEEMLAHLPSDT